MGDTQTISEHSADLPLGLRLIAGAAMAGVVGVSAWWLSRAVMIALAPESQWVAPLPVRAASVTRRSLPSLDTEFDAFHRALPSEDVPEEVGLDAPETTLNLVLKGHRAGPDGSAYIQTPDRAQRNYYVGEEILAGVTLETVGRGFVVISRSGQLERLSQRDDGEVFGEASGDDTTRNRRTPGLDADARRRPSPASPSPTSAPPPRLQPTNTLSPDRKVGTRDDDGPDLSALVAGDLLQIVSLAVVRDGDRTRGYRITENGNGGMPLSEFGLQSGDIVSKINGQDLTKGRPDLMALSEQLQRRPDATLVVERDGALMTVRIGSQ